MRPACAEPLRRRQGTLLADCFSILLEQAGGLLILQLRAKVDQLLFEC